MSSLPKTWRAVRLVEVCEVNPRDRGPEDMSSIVSFVPMPAVSDVDGKILAHEARAFSEVSKGYTRFRNGDVIFAKITPCMENGKIAVATNLRGGIACGSTEFHVLRAGKDVLPEYIWRFLRQSGYRENAAGSMTGAVGQRRVPADFLKNSLLPLPPLCEQQNIVAKLARLSIRAENARKELDPLKNLVKRYKHSVLAAAFRGDLTARWRAENPGGSSTGDFLALRAKVATNRRSGAQFGRDERSALIDRDHELSGALFAAAEAVDLPRTWAWCGIGEAFGVYVGATPSRKEAAYWEGDVPWVSSGEVAFCHIDQTAEAISKAGLKNTSTRLHPPGTVLLGMIGEGKTRGQAAILDIEACNNQNCAAIRVSEAGYSPEYVYWYFYAVYEQTRNAGSGNNQSALNKTKVQRLPIPLAPPMEAAEVSRIIQAYLEPLRHVESELASAQKLLSHFDTRVSEMAFRGELSHRRDEGESLLASVGRRLAASGAA